MCIGSLANTGVTSIICLLVKDVFLFVQATSNIYIRDYPFVKLVHKANHFFGKKEKIKKGLNLRLRTQNQVHFSVVAKI